MKKDKYQILLFLLLIFLTIFSIYALKPQIAGDSFHYLDSIKVLKTGEQPAGFVPMMIVSNYLGLGLLVFLDVFFRNLAISWLLLNSLLYVAMGMLFYALLKKFSKNGKTALLGTLFVAVNYAVVVFGLSYMMDLGGWVAYIASLYFSYCYLKLETENGGSRWLFYSALAIGIGGLYKEYAFVAYVVILGLILFKNWKFWSKIIWQIFLTGCLAFGPFLFLNIYGYLAFHYTYIDWFLENQNGYHQNKIIEFIKSFGSVFNFGWFLFIPGFYILIKRSKEAVKNKITDKNIIFIWLTILSCFSVLLWPVVTRVLFITVPALVLVSSLFIEKIDKCFAVLILGLYAVSAYLMDAYILKIVNLPL